MTLICAYLSSKLQPNIVESTLSGDIKLTKITCVRLCVTVLKLLIVGGTQQRQFDSESNAA